MSFPSYEKYKDSGVEWLGKYPSYWGSKPLWAMFRRIKQINFKHEELLSVYRDFGVIPKSSRGDNFNKPSEDLSTYQLVKKGELVVNKMKAWQGSIAISNYRGIVSPAYHVYERIHNENSRYLHYLMRSPQYITGYLSMSKGIRVNQWDLEPKLHSRMLVLLPPLKEQKVIASFLDAETTKIDALVAEQQRLIALLKEKRQAVISHAVTKGLNPDAPMKPSGVEWLGDIPKHWEVKKVRRIFTLRKRIAGELGYEVLSITQQGIKVKDLDSNEGQHSMDYSKYQLVFPGDFAMNHMDLLTGYIDVSKQIGVTSPDYRVFNCNNEEDYEQIYYLYIFQMGYLQKIFFAYGQGSSQLGRWRLPTKQFKDLAFPVPPKKEQAKIVDYIGTICEKLNKLQTEAEHSIKLLQERRTALISAAVTGKIDVRNYALQRAA